MRWAWGTSGSLVRLSLLCPGLPRCGSFRLAGKTRDISGDLSPMRRRLAQEQNHPFADSNAENRLPETCSSVVGHSVARFVRAAPVRQPETRRVLGQPPGCREALCGNAFFPLSGFPSPSACRLLERSRKRPASVRLTVSRSTVIARGPSRCHRVRRRTCSGSAYYCHGGNRTNNSVCGIPWNDEPTGGPADTSESNFRPFSIVSNCSRGIGSNAGEGYEPGRLHAKRTVDRARKQHR